MSLDISSKVELDMSIKKTSQGTESQIVYIEMNLLADWGFGIATNIVSPVYELSANTVVEIAQNKIGFFSNLPWRAGFNSN